MRIDPRCSGSSHLTGARSPSGACSAMATPSAKMRLQQLFEAYDTSGDGDCLCENLQVFSSQPVGY